MTVVYVAVCLVWIGVSSVRTLCAWGIERDEIYTMRRDIINQMVIRLCIHTCVSATDGTDIEKEMALTEFAVLESIACCCDSSMLGVVVVLRVGG